MVFRSRLRFALLPLVLLAASPAAAQVGGVPSPRDVVGFEPGEDRRLAGWSQIVDYFKRLDSASPRVSVHQLGVSTERRPFIVAIISAEKNIENLSRIRQAQAQLADPRKITSPEERERLIRETPAVVAITCSIHSTEIVASQMAMELAYRLASDRSAATTEILNNTVLLLIPSVNPDGIDIVADWYRKTLGTKFEGTSPPTLYHRYAGHDNNRDWFMLTQVETQLVSTLFWREWFPEIVYDVHQQGQFGSRMCVPPFFDPHNPNIDPVIVRQVGAIGMRMAANLTAAGYKGIVTNSTYDMWWHGGLRSAPYYHNAIGILTEAASARIATPIDVRREQLRSTTRGLADPLVPATNFPLVWEGGRWSMRDILNMELITCRTALEEAAERREELIRSFVEIADRAIEAGRREAPYAYIIPAPQHDAPTARRMIEILVQQGVEVHQATSDFTVDGRKYGKGSYVILLAQPYRANVKCLFESQRYPDRRLYPGGPAEQPYDVAGWTLPMQMGVGYVETKSRFDASLVSIDSIPEPPRILPYRGGARNVSDRTGLITSNAPRPYHHRFYLSPETNNSFALINEIIKLPGQVAISRSIETVEAHGTEYPAGTFIIEQTRLKNNPYNLRELVDKYQLKADWEESAIGNRAPKSAVERFKRSSLKQPKLGLYRGWTVSMDEGWTRWVLEQFGFDYKSLYDSDVRAGNLKNSFDVIILPDQSLREIVAGNREGAYPPEYTGGITDAGVANLRSFVEAGGVLICLDSASELAIERFDLPVKNVLDGLRRDQFYAPGSIFRATVDTTHPIAYGMPQEADLYFVSGSQTEAASAAVEPVGAARPAGQPRVILVSAFAFEITDPARARSVARFVEDNPLRSGWLLGPQYVAGKSALVDVSLGRGRVVLFGFRTQHRAQTWGTFKFLFNSIMLGGMNSKEAASATHSR